MPRRAVRCRRCGWRGQRARHRQAAAALATNGGEALDYLEGVGRGRTLTRQSLPFIAIPTTAGSGAEATRNSVLRVPDLKVKRSLRSEFMIPRVAVIDPRLAKTCPLPVAASAGLDALTHLIEGYVSNGAQPTTDAFALRGIRIAKGCRRYHEASRMWRAWLLQVSGAASCSRMQDSVSVNGLVAPLGGRCSVPHGMGCACLLSAAMETNIEALRERSPESFALPRYREIEEALRGIPALDVLRRDLGVPPLQTFGLTREEIPAVIAGSRAGSMNYNPIVLTDAELESILIQSLS